MEPSIYALLTTRQKECLRLVATAYTGKQIAEQLGIAPVTVENHLKAARFIVGLPTSGEAGRLLVAHERCFPETSTGESRPAESASVQTTRWTNGSTWDEQSPQSDVVSVGEVRTPFGLPERVSKGVMPALDRPGNSLDSRARIVIIIKLAAQLLIGLAAAVGATLWLSEYLVGLSRNGG